MINASAADLVTVLGRRGETLAAAESLTGGLVCAVITEVPGASAVLRGGIVAYTPEIKEALAGVDPATMSGHGLVSSQVAEALAVGARDRCATDWGIGTTGAAGPEAHDGAPVGEVWVAVAGPSGVTSRRGRLTGDRRQVRHGAVDLALGLLNGLLDVDVK